MTKRQWVFDPDYSGVKIPDHKKTEVKQRIESFAAKHHAGKYTSLEIRFRRQFCYIDAYTEPSILDGDFFGIPEDSFAASALNLEG